MSLETIIGLYLLMGLLLLAILWVPLNRYANSRSKEIMKNHFWAVFITSALVYAVAWPYWFFRDSINLLMCLERRRAYRKEMTDKLIETLEEMVRLGKFPGGDK